ncbi:hypothetical protein PFICI_00754 [Pestalotiopsis fici W106-1]|uniref:Rhodopsin domain-containing protein n=1 Tax=Pestalotiopsis fici (strain W106-1 / CGMCC3.15140) TaxID=1229662 RepID=W3XNT2_PESFW|nr:uncharacterized protein PFICI_00754 [Pestalotiopsis fici W106-1]ETS86926.1 hypothetical protein PFICI_00754 [Pestalotiopsis fici W106-1]
MAFPSGQAPMVLAVMWVQTILTLIFVLLRLYTRRILLRNIGPDDHLSWISMVLFILYTTFVTVAAFHGLGNHAADITLEQFAESTKWELMGQSSNILAIATSKCSVAIFLVRIVVQDWHKWALHFCIWSTVFVCVSCIILMYTQCTPVHGIWDPRVTDTVCHINFTADAIFSGSYTAAMDFFLAIFPWFILWNLNMKRKERLTVSIGLSLGIIAGICGIVRAVELEAIDSKADYPYVTVPILIWGSSELMVCILCATIPVLRPFYKHVTGRGSSTDPYSNKNYGSQGPNGSNWQELEPTSRTKNATESVTWKSRNAATVKGDNASDESALFQSDDADTRKFAGGIKRTTEVNVSYA